MPPKTALLVVDMQVFFQSMTATALPNIITLCDHFSRKSAPIIFTQHGHSKEELTANPPRNQLVRKWGPSGSIATGSKDWELVKELRQYMPKDCLKQLSIGECNPGADSPDFPKTLAKNTYDAFLNSPLSAVLDAAKVERVVVCGVMTDCCCDTTARSSFNRGYETWLVSDACGSANQTQHQAGLKAFEFGFGEVLKTKNVIELLGE